MLKKVKVEVRSQKGYQYHKIKVTNLLCDKYFPGLFARRYRWWQSFDHVASSNQTFDGAHVKIRSNKVKFLNQHFLHKKHMLLAQNLLSVPNMPLVFFYDA